jgi:hypothetical protein
MSGVSSEREITRRAFVGGVAAAGTALALGRVGHIGFLQDAHAASGTWLAGDLHVHTCYSHDVLCPGDDNTGPDLLYAAGFNVAQRFQQAQQRGLHYLAITDHNDVRAVTDPGFGTRDVIAIPAYEASIRGHAQMLGARKIYDRGKEDAAAAAAMAREVRAVGGVFQANHPAYRIDSRPEGCDHGACTECGTLNWKYEFDVRPDTVEVWNAASPPNEVAENYWECWLNRGERIGATGGSDSHWASTNDVQGPGQPTTWIFAGDRSAAGLLEGLRRGRTTISAQPPARGGIRLLLEADPRGDGSFDAMMGDVVKPGTPMRVRAEDLARDGVVRLRANGRQLGADRAIGPGGEVRFEAPAQPGWVRATLLMDSVSEPRAEGCGSEQGQAEIFNCRGDLIIVALTSPIYLDEPETSFALKAVSRRTLSEARLRRPLRVAIRSTKAARVRVTLKGRLRPKGRRSRLRARDVTIATSVVRVGGNGRVVVKLQPRRWFRRALRRRRLTSARLVVRGRALDGRTATAKRRLRVRRRPQARAR